MITFTRRPKYLIKSLSSNQKMVGTRETVFGGVLLYEQLCGSYG